MKKPLDQCLFHSRCSISSNYYYLIFFERTQKNILHNYLSYETECTEHNLTHFYLFKIVTMKIIAMCLMGPLFPSLSHVKFLYLCYPLMVLHFPIVVIICHLDIPGVSNKVPYFIHNGSDAVLQSTLPVLSDNEKYSMFSQILESSFED